MSHTLKESRAEKTPPRKTGIFPWSVKLSMVKRAVNRRARGTAEQPPREIQYGLAGTCPFASCALSSSKVLAEGKASFF